MADANKDYAKSGLDIKSIVINIASTLLFVLPILLYFYDGPANHLILGVAAVMGLGWLMPPMGWRRPHPYSDDPTNRPAATKND